jgi:hypothetical protein
MASISASTTHKITKTVPKAAAPAKASVAAKKGPLGKPAAKGAVSPRGSVAPKLVPSTLGSADAIGKLKESPEVTRREKVIDMLHRALGDDTLVDKSKPHTASTTKDRAGAAADVATAAKELGLQFVFKKCGVLDELQRMLFPDGVDKLYTTTSNPTGGLRPSASSVSLASLDIDDDITAASSFSGATDTKRGKSTPPNAREGALLIIRAFCQIVGKPAEPYIVGGFLAAALDECGSSTSAVREAAEDTAKALVSIASPWAFARLTCPLIVHSLNSTEWRVKATALERLAQCATTCPDQVNYALPDLIPIVTGQVWDTKAQVTKAANTALLSICKTCKNPDIAPAIPAVVQAIAKPSDTNKAVEELMATTFVATVDSSTLAILCPVLARALKEKMALHKRAACLVISNMSRLVENPEAVAPFGPLLVPELKKVAENVQFDEIRDEALKALANLTKALGDAYNSEESGKKDMADAENARVEEERKRIAAERQEELDRQIAYRKKEEEERRRFKEAMDAQRELEKIEATQAKAAKIASDKKKDEMARSTKGASGVCQGCGLKKCLPTCHFKK